MIPTFQFNINNTKFVLPADKVAWDTSMNMKFSPEPSLITDQSTESVDLPNLEESIQPSDTTISSTELDLEERKLFQYAVFDIDDMYFLDYSIPSEMNVDGIALRFGDLKVDYIKKTRLALALVTTGLSVAMIVGLLTLPKPYNLASLALCGPLFVSTYGLLTQK